RGVRRVGMQAIAAAIAAAAASAQTTMPLATIKDIRRTVLPDAVRITIELGREVAFHAERIPDSVRVFVDFSGARAAAPLIDRALRVDPQADANFVRPVRFGRHPNNVTRVVLDGRDVSSSSVYPLYSPFRVVIDCVGGSAPRLTDAPIERPTERPAAPVALP